MSNQVNYCRRRRASTSVTTLGVVLCGLVIAIFAGGCPGLEGPIIPRDAWEAEQTADRDVPPPDAESFEYDEFGEKTGTFLLNACSECDGRFVNERQPNSLYANMFRLRSIAGDKLKADSIGSTHIRNGSILSRDIKDLNVTTSDLATNAVTAVKIASNAVGISELSASNGSSGRYLMHTGNGMKWDSVIRQSGTRIGIGTASPMAKLHVAGNTRMGNSILNTHVWWGWLQTGSASDVHKLLPAVDWWGTVGMSIRAWYQMYAYDYYNKSSRDVKRDITPLSRGELAGMLEKVEAIDVVRFLYKGEYYEGEVVPEGSEEKVRSVARLGVIAETLPPEVVDPTGTCVNLSSYTAMLHAAVKELSERVREQTTVSGEPSNGYWNELDALSSRVARVEELAPAFDMMAVQTQVQVQQEQVAALQDENAELRTRLADLEAIVHELAVERGPGE